MKYIKYKQICRFTFFGTDDELRGNVSSLSKTSSASDAAVESDTKRLRFRFTPMNSVDLSQFAKIVIESLYMPSVVGATNTGGAGVPNAILNGMVTIRTSSLSSVNNFDTENKGNNSLLMFWSYFPNTMWYNNYPETMYNFPVSKSFLQQGQLDLMVTYPVSAGNVQNLEKFAFSVIIYDIDEEDLLLKDTPEWKKEHIRMQYPQNNGRYYNLSN